MPGYLSQHYPKQENDPLYINVWNPMPPPKKIERIASIDPENPEPSTLKTLNPSILTLHYRAAEAWKASVQVRSLLGGSLATMSLTFKPELYSGLEFRVIQILNMKPFILYESVLDPKPNLDLIRNLSINPMNNPKP